MAPKKTRPGHASSHDAMKLAVMLLDIILRPVKFCSDDRYWQVQPRFLKEGQKGSLGSSSGSSDADTSTAPETWVPSLMGLNSDWMADLFYMPPEGAKYTNKTLKKRTCMEMTIAKFLHALMCIILPGLLVVGQECGPGDFLAWMLCFQGKVENRFMAGGPKFKFLLDRWLVHVHLGHSGALHECGRRHDIDTDLPPNHARFLKSGMAHKHSMTKEDDGHGKCRWAVTLDHKAHQATERILRDFVAGRTTAGHSAADANIAALLQFATQLRTKYTRATVPPVPNVHAEAAPDTPGNGADEEDDEHRNTDGTADTTDGQAKQQSDTTDSQARQQPRKHTQACPEWPAGHAFPGRTGPHRG